MIVGVIAGMPAEFLEEASGAGDAVYSLDFKNAVYTSGGASSTLEDLTDDISGIAYPVPTITPGVGLVGYTDPGGDWDISAYGLAAGPKAMVLHDDGAILVMTGIVVDPEPTSNKSTALVHMMNTAFGQGLLFEVKAHNGDVFADNSNVAGGYYETNDLADTLPSPFKMAMRVTGLTSLTAETSAYSVNGLATKSGAPSISDNPDFIAVGGHNGAIVEKLELFSVADYPNLADLQTLSAP